MQFWRLLEITRDFAVDGGGTSRYIRQMQICSSCSAMKLAISGINLGSFVDIAVPHSFWPDFSS